MMPLIKRCDGMVPDGETCQLCGRVHEPIWKSPYLWLAIIAAGAVLWWLWSTYSGRQLLRQWDVIPYEHGEGYWTFRNSGTAYPSTMNPADVLREDFVIIPKFRDLRNR